MAKGQVTEQDLVESLDAMGGLGGLGRGARRDSPFGSDFVKRQAPTPTAAPAAVVAKPLPAEPAAVKTVELKTPSFPSKAEKRAEPKKIERPRTQAVQKEKIPETKEAKEAKITRKADVLSERVTIQMSADMRDEVNALAAKLQRRKTDRSTERITANTVMRVAIQVFLDSFKSESGSPNTEDELLDLAKKALR